MELAQIISLVKAASGVLLNQKNVAFYEEATYKSGNSILGALGIDTNTVLGGVFSGTKEVLIGGKIGADVGPLNSVASFILGNEPLEAGISLQSKIMEHPIEYNVRGSNSYKNGIGAAQNFVVDHQIILPVEINVALVLPMMLYSAVIEEIQNLVYTKELLAIVTRAGVYRRMCLRGVSTQLKVENLSRMIFVLNFREIQIQFPTSKVAESDNNSDTVSA